MSAFEQGDELRQDVAFRLLTNTSVTLFWRRRVLDETLERLVERGYEVTIVDASTWSSESDLHEGVASALGLPDHYGRNLDALDDCMRDVVAHEYGWDPDATGLVLVFTGYDRFAAACPRSAQAVLDIMARQSRAAALVGGRFMCLVQSDDPQIGFQDVGATPVLWNDAEWAESRRRPG
ncbi:barstar family protein [Cellulomonas dongxiuzhuiae]|uniref:Barstar family protein n=1 Tax=Cellulomonas dongxiuzhuiae TaxID=2819979 RepID=A0ABX8GIG0_9CELL|nr:barstar family protein [Cellulomonas dongxiuzhuiae]MBO3094971.1 barstar family protein [Cellulomonas dongxiuzhuiae]QWC15989.1 barstar family protein [Cellulomonas dongxiuzhuiae]